MYLTRCVSTTTIARARAHTDSKKFFGVPGFFSSLGEKAQIAKDLISTLQSMNKVATASSKLEGLSNPQQQQQQQQPDDTVPGSNASAADSKPPSKSSTSKKAAATAVAADDVVAMQAQRERLEAEAQEAVLGVTWAFTKIDVEHTLRAVCDAVLHDQTVSDEVRDYRAKALKIIGSVFTAVPLVPATSTTAASTSSSTSSSSSSSS
mgnify:FL=1